jgi:methionyl-tRNA formyltransferase
MARVLLIGLGASSASALDSLLQRFDVVGVVRSPDVRDPESDLVVRRARQAKVPVFTDASPRSIERIVEEYKPDCVVVSSYNRLFASRLIESCPFINVHYGPLPRYRGMATVNWAILNGEQRTALTIHTIVKGMDEGRMLYQEFVPIGGDDTVVDVYERLNELQRKHLADAVTRFLAGEAGVAQNDNDATYGCNRMPQDGHIDWALPTRQVYALVRALVAPFPGAYTYLRGDRLIVWKAVPVADPPKYEGRVPGRVIAISKSDGWIDVLTGDGVLRLLQVQLENGEPTVPASLVRSVRTTLGLNVGELLTRLRALEDQVAELSRTIKELTKHASV